MAVNNNCGDEFGNFANIENNDEDDFIEEQWSGSDDEDEDDDEPDVETKTNRNLGHSSSGNHKSDSDDMTIIGHPEHDSDLEDMMTLAEDYPELHTHNSNPDSNYNINNGRNDMVNTKTTFDASAGDKLVLDEEEAEQRKKFATFQARMTHRSRSSKVIETLPKPVPIAVGEPIFIRVQPKPIPEQITTRLVSAHYFNRNKSKLKKLKPFPEPKFEPFPSLYPEFKYKFECREGYGFRFADDDKVETKANAKESGMNNFEQDCKNNIKPLDLHTDNDKVVCENETSCLVKNYEEKSDDEESITKELDIPKLVLDTSQEPFVVRRRTASDEAQLQNFTFNKYEMKSRANLESLKVLKSLEQLSSQKFDTYLVDFTVAAAAAPAHTRKHGAGLGQVAWRTPPGTPSSSSSSPFSAAGADAELPDLESHKVESSPSAGSSNYLVEDLAFKNFSLEDDDTSDEIWETISEETVGDAYLDDDDDDDDDQEKKKLIAIATKTLHEHEAKIADSKSDESLLSNNNNCKVKNSEELLELFVLKQPISRLLRQEIIEDATPKYYSIGQLNGATKFTVDKSKVSENLKEFVTLPAPVGFLIQCSIFRDRKGVDRGLFPTYYMHLEYEDGTKVFLLSARKRKKSKTSNYLLSIDPIILTKETMVGKLRSNLLGTQFNIFGNGKSPRKSVPFLDSKDELREEFGVVAYDYNILGFRGPRKLHAFIPAMLNEHQRFTHRPESESDSLPGRMKTDLIGGIIELKNNPPTWHEGNQSYCLNFHGRVSKPSVKNFQLVHPAKEDYTILQFGRASDDGHFTLDFRFPLCPLQALAFALTSFDNKLACE